MLIINGTGDNTLFTKLMNDIVYENSNEFPSKYQRRVTISVEDLKNKSSVTKDILISVNRTEISILISGKCNQNSFQKNFTENNKLILCPDIQLEMKGCSQHIDSMWVQTDTKLIDGENITIDLDLGQYGLKLKPSENGFTIYGISLVENYKNILQNINYSFNEEIMNKVAARKIRVRLFS